MCVRTEREALKESSCRTNIFSTCRGFLLKYVGRINAFHAASAPPLRMAATLSPLKNETRCRARDARLLYAGLSHIYLRLNRNRPPQSGSTTFLCSFKIHKNNSSVETNAHLVPGSRQTSGRKWDNSQRQRVCTRTHRSRLLHSRAPQWEMTTLYVVYNFLFYIL